MDEVRSATGLPKSPRDTSQGSPKLLLLPFFTFPFHILVQSYMSDGTLALISSLALLSYAARKIYIA